MAIDNQIQNEVKQAVVAMVEILHENYDLFLTQYKAGEFDPNDLKGLKQLAVEFAKLNERTADMFRQVAAIVEHEIAIETPRNDKRCSYCGRVTCFGRPCNPKYV